MTREEIAEYYFNTENQYSYADDIEQLKESIIPAVLYGYDEGYNQSRKENEELKNFIDENENREKELCILCENLKAQILGLQNNIDGQKARKHHHIKENAKLTSEVAELKAQIEKMKNCENCKWNFIIGDYEPCNKCNDENDKWECVE